MKSFNILILEDDLKTLSVIMDVLAQLEEDLRYNFLVTVYSTYKDVEEIVNKVNLQKFDMILLDRDCKLGGSFHVLNIEKIDPNKIVSISAIYKYNEEALARGVRRVITKDHDNLKIFALQLSEQVRLFLFKYVKK